MKRNDEICEFDGYDFSDIPKNPNSITKEEEDRLIAEMVERVKKRKAEQDARKAQQTLKKPSNTTSISITAAQNISMVRTNR